MTLHTQIALWSATPIRPRSLAERPLDQWPTQERPIERLYTVGAASVSDVELLAVILGSCGKINPVTIAGELLAQSGGWYGLQQLSLAEIAAIAGMSRSKAAVIKAALEVARRAMLHSAVDRFHIRSPADAAQLLMAEMSHLDQEQLRVLCLNTKNRILKIQTVYVGSLNSSIVRIGEVFKEAVRLNAAAIIVAHNHPSGDASPSPEDVQVTRQIVQAGELLEVEVLDHLVIGHGTFVSMRERGLGFSE